MPFVAPARPLLRARDLTDTAFRDPFGNAFRITERSAVTTG